MTTLFIFGNPELPSDCCYLIYQYLPRYIVDRCHTCGVPLVLKDKRNRLHYEPFIVCTESILVCDICYENYEIS